MDAGGGDVAPFAESRSAIVDDSTDVGPGQMTRGAFMAELRSSLTAICNRELAAVGRTADGCPYLQRWLDYYKTRPADAIVRAARLYAGATADADARGLLDVVGGRVRSAVLTWIAGGGITGVPEGASLMPPERGVAASTEGSSAAAAAPNDLSALQAQLGPGRPLDAGVRSRMVRSFGSLEKVRVHTDQHAARMASGLGSRAFTLGNDVVFASGQYRPGTLVGDLLLAHELAHTRQQAGSASPVRSAAAEPGHERAADRAALKTLLGKPANVPTGLGLRLQRCFVAAPAAEVGVTELSALIVGEEVAAATAPTVIASTAPEVIAGTAPEVIAGTAPEVVAATAPEAVAATRGATAVETLAKVGKIAGVLGTGGLVLEGKKVPKPKPETEPKKTAEPTTPTKPTEEEKRKDPLHASG